MGRRDSYLLDNMMNSEKMYLEANKKFSENEKYISYGADLYKYLIKHNEKISAIEKIIQLKGLNKVLGSANITSQMYLSKWKQSDFAEFQKKFSNMFSVLDSKKLTKINISKKK